jgi:hypothetical protein
LLNVVETFLNMVYLYLAHLSASSSAPVVGFASVALTLGKTALYLLQEYFCHGCMVGHNDLKTLIVYWIIPNGYAFVFCLVPISIYLCCLDYGSFSPP